MSDENPVLDYRQPEISSFGRRILQTYLKLRGRKPSLGRYLRLSWKAYLVLLIFFAAAHALLWMMGMQEMAFALVGAFFGALLRDLGTFRQLQRAWPVLERIIDWRRVEELAQTPQRPL